jgi:hypothetical protein
MAHSVFAARVVDQDAAHAFSCGGEKMGAIAPLWLPIAAESEPDFVNKRGRLKGLTRRFARDLGRR